MISLPDLPAIPMDVPTVDPIENTISVEEVHQDIEGIGNLIQTPLFYNSQIATYRFRGYNQI